MRIPLRRRVAAVQSWSVRTRRDGRAPSWTGQPITNVSQVASVSRTGSASGASFAAPFAPWQQRRSKRGGSVIFAASNALLESRSYAKSASSKSSKRARTASLGAPASSSAIDRAVPAGAEGAGDRGMCAALVAPPCGSEPSCLNNRRSNVSTTRHSARLAPSSGARRAASIRARPCSS